MVTPTRPKVSIFIIAYNEEKLIERCLRSIEKQTIKADEIILIAHNCTDRTEEIARKFPWLKVIPYTGPSGIVYARAEGFRQVSGDIIVGTDADTKLPPKWLKEMLEPFNDNRVVAVGSGVIYKGNILSTSFSFIGSVSLFVRGILPGTVKEFWGPSFALRRSTYEAFGGLEPLIALREKCNFTHWLDDLYLSQQCGTHGSVDIAPLFVIARTKEESATGTLRRTRDNIRDRYLFFQERKDRN